MCNEVECFGSTARPDNIFAAWRTNKLCDLFTRAFKLAGGLRRQTVATAMYIGIVLAVVVADGINHTLWFLRSGRTVEIDQRVTVDDLLQRRKLRADCIKIEHQ
ncbi:Uncharacterised protein [Vibrio cholerae]|uniref:Uncharacterized protein n=1 Tax=Vibrio cholerae TaxID=666 RepID=A0A656AL59_VIBCL|nr:Uncharacterised protein [Vibrio cholerae]CSA64187.1 Uncharacterised protein [Vibrio cholerae]CSB37253.1 Uncharacterised protein [Vibrio cholerae]CSB83708.1 Uncharacterised protein [Vibrio cholerae]CSC03143.1 Uncharacterised protein [Vibrio cholerae]